MLKIYHSLMTSETTREPQLHSDIGGTPTLKISNRVRRGSVGDLELSQILIRATEDVAYPIRTLLHGNKNPRQLSPNPCNVHLDFLR